jgi:adenosylmethionine-8-amino-7-oxononanoate aminotransferase
MENTKVLCGKDKKHVIHPWADLGSFLNTEPTVIAEANGYIVVDTDGNQYIDGIAGMWCVNIGYGRKEMAEAIAEQAVRMPYYTPFGANTNVPAVELAAKLSELTPGDINWVHYANSGSAAVDSALRFVQYYFNSLGKPEKKQIITRDDAYHGSTYLTASLSGKQVDKSYFDYIKKFIHHLPTPNPSSRPENMSIDEFCDVKVKELEDKILELGADKVACFIAEPILGSGGVIVPPSGYQKRTFEICRKYDVLYISDEVVTGFGRLGHFFASKNVFDIIPDIIITAKGITSGYQPLGAAIISDRLFQKISGKMARPNSFFTNGYTFSGHPVACAAALKNIEIIEREKINDHVKQIGPYFLARLSTLEEIPVVNEVRGHHLMACVECVIDETGPTETNIAFASKIDRYCQDNGLILRPYGELCILSPPLILDKPGIDRIVEIMKNSILKAQEEIKWLQKKI